MAGITLAQAQAQLALWLAASEAVAANKAYSIDGRVFTRQDADKVLEGVKFWNAMVQSLDRGGIKVGRVTPL